jgi:hypothetical protein
MAAAAREAMKHDVNGPTGQAQPPKSKPKRRLVAVASLGEPTFRTGETEAATGRKHGDSYGDVLAREEDFSVTTSSHAGRADRRPEEPSESPLDAPERLEGST